MIVLFLLAFSCSTFDVCSDPSICSAKVGSICPFINNSMLCCNTNYLLSCNAGSVTEALFCEYGCFDGRCLKYDEENALCETDSCVDVHTLASCTTTVKNCSRAFTEMAPFIWYPLYSDMSEYINGEIHPVISGSPTSSRPGYSFKSSDSLTVALPLTPTTNVSISVKFMRDRINVTEPLISASSGDFRIFLTATDSIQVELNEVNLTGVNDVQTGSVFHVAWTYTSTRTVLFVDGVEIDYSSYTFLPVDLSTLVLGNGFEGVIADFLLFDRELDSVEVWWLYSTELRDPLGTVELKQMDHLHCDYGCVDGTCVNCVVNSDCSMNKTGTSYQCCGKDVHECVDGELKGIVRTCSMGCNNQNCLSCYSNECDIGKTCPVTSGFFCCGQRRVECVNSLIVDNEECPFGCEVGGCVPSGRELCPISGEHQCIGDFNFNQTSRKCVNIDSMNCRKRITDLNPLFWYPLWNDTSEWSGNYYSDAVWSPNLYEGGSSYPKDGIFEFEGWGKWTIPDSDTAIEQHIDRSYTFTVWAYAFSWYSPPHAMFGSTRPGLIFGNNGANCDSMHIKTGWRKINFAHQCGQTLGSYDILNLNEWFHLTVTYDDPGQQRIYINGELNVYTTSESVQFPLLNGGSSISIGGATNIGSWDGMIRDFMLFPRVLNEDEILNIMTRPHCDPSTQVEVNEIQLSTCEYGCKRDTCYGERVVGSFCDTNTSCVGHYVHSCDLNRNEILDNGELCSLGCSGGACQNLGAICEKSFCIGDTNVACQGGTIVDNPICEFGCNSEFGQCYQEHSMGSICNSSIYQYCHEGNYLTCNEGYITQIQTCTLECVEGDGCLCQDCDFHGTTCCANSIRKCNGSSFNNDDAIDCPGSCQDDFCDSCFDYVGCLVGAKNTCLNETACCGRKYLVTCLNETVESSQLCPFGCIDSHCLEENEEGAICSEENQLTCSGAHSVLMCLQAYDPSTCAAPIYNAKPLAYWPMLTDHIDWSENDPPLDLIPFGEISYGDGACNLTSNMEYFQLPTFDPSTSYSFCLWFYLYPREGSFLISIFGNEGWADVNGKVHINVQYDESTNWKRVITVGIWNGNYLLSENEVEMGKWHHMCLTYTNGGQAKLFVDGVLGDESPQNDHYLQLWNPSLRVWLGKNYDLSRYLGGKIKQVVFFDREIDEMEVVEIGYLTRGHLTETEELFYFHRQSCPFGCNESSVECYEQFSIDSWCETTVCNGKTRVVCQNNRATNVEECIFGCSPLSGECVTQPCENGWICNVDGDFCCEDNIYSCKDEIVTERIWNCGYHGCDQQHSCYSCFDIGYCVEGSTCSVFNETYCCGEEVLVTCIDQVISSAVMCPFGCSNGKCLKENELGSYCTTQTQNESFCHLQTDLHSLVRCTREEEICNGNIVKETEPYIWFPLGELSTPLDDAMNVEDTIWPGGFVSEGISFNEVFGTIWFSLGYDFFEQSGFLGDFVALSFKSAIQNNFPSIQLTVSMWLYLPEYDDGGMSALIPFGCGSLAGGSYTNNLIIAITRGLGEHGQSDPNHYLMAILSDDDLIVSSSLGENFNEEWHHIALTIDITAPVGEIQKALYLDGELVNYVNQTGVSTIPINWDCTTGLGPWYGGMKDVIIYSRVLSGKEVHSLYSNWNTNPGFPERNRVTIERMRTVESCQYGCNNETRSCYGQYDMDSICDSNECSSEKGYTICRENTIVETGTCEKYCSGLTKECAMDDCSIGGKCSEGFECCNNNVATCENSWIVQIEDCGPAGCSDGSCVIVEGCLVGSSCESPGSFCCDGFSAICDEYNWISKIEDCGPTGCSEGICSIQSGCSYGAKCEGEGKICCEDNFIVCDNGWVINSTSCEKGCQNSRCMVSSVQPNNVGAIVGSTVSVVLFFVFLFIVLVVSIIVGYFLWKKFKPKTVDDIAQQEMMEGMANVKVDASLYSIKYEDLKIEEKIGAGGSNSMVFKAKWFFVLLL